jgi:hypothetical protein
MTPRLRTNRLGLLAATIVAVFASVQCAKSASPTTPTTPTTSVSGVALNATVAAGTTLQGTVSLTGPASIGGASIALSSSNTSVATVQTPVMIQSGASTATFTVAGMGAGSVTITATFNGTGQSAALTVTGPAAALVTLSSLSLNAYNVVGGHSLSGTATLSGPAPAGGADVSLTASDPVVVGVVVGIPAGLTSATFTASTHAVSASTLATITGAYGGAHATAVLTVLPADPAAAIADFGVTGTEITDTCHLIDSGHSLDCTFDGSASTAPGTIVAWEWSYTVATTITQTTSGPRLTVPNANCALVPPPPLPAGVPSFKMAVTLRIHDSLGNVSAAAVATDIRVLPQGACGF